MVQLKTSDMKC